VYQVYCQEGCQQRLLHKVFGIEVEGERQEIGLREKLIFASEKSSELSGTYDDAMKFIDAIRCDSLYSHECSANCKVKGSWNTCTVNTV
jgi:hypothetical protein